MENFKHLNMPKTKKEIKQFLGTIGWYKKCIPDVAKFTKPFTKCLKNGKLINIYDTNFRKCFEKCKTILCNSCSFTIPGFF